MLQDKTPLGLPVPLVLRQEASSRWEGNYCTHSLSEMFKWLNRSKRFLCQIINLSQCPVPQKSWYQRQKDTSFPPQPPAALATAQPGHGFWRSWALQTGHRNVLWIWQGWRGGHQNTGGNKLIFSCVYPLVTHSLMRDNNGPDPARMRRCWYLHPIVNSPEGLGVTQINI